jgi:hypothetical protein
MDALHVILTLDIHAQIQQLGLVHQHARTHTIVETVLYRLLKPEMMATIFRLTDEIQPAKLILGLPAQLLVPQFVQKYAETVLIFIPMPVMTETIFMKTGALPFAPFTLTSSEGAEAQACVTTALKSCRTESTTGGTAATMETQVIVMDETSTAELSQDTHVTKVAPIAQTDAGLTEVTD